MAPRGRTKRNTKAARRKRVVFISRLGIAVMAVLLSALLFFGFFPGDTSGAGDEAEDIADIEADRPNMDVQLLTVNPYSRPGIEMGQVKSIVVHYTANPGTSAQNNRDYFEGLKNTQAAKVSSHFVIGTEGEVIQCIPTGEMAYASNDRNMDSIAIECCHPDETGGFTQETYDSLVELTAWLCRKFGLTEKDILRHYDITGKSCPKSFVDDPEEWDKFGKDVGKKIDNS